MTREQPSRRGGHRLTYTGEVEALRADAAAFKNFHRALCDRFGYTHDEKDWRRDQVSLEEHIARQAEALWQTVKSAVEMIDNMKYAQSGDGAHEDSFDFMQRNYRKALRAAIDTARASTDEGVGK